MAYAAAPAEPKRRPAVVTVACWLLYLAAAGQVLSAVVTFSQLGTTKRVYDEVFAKTSVTGAAEMSVAIMAASAMIAVVFGIGYVVLAILNGRGKNPARIVTWVLAGIAICFSGCGLAATAIGASDFGGSSANSDVPSAQEIQRALGNAWPGWYEPLVTTLGIISLAALVTAVVLLALPAAHDFFRKQPEAGWEPPAPSVPPVPPPTA
ncbi:hypothetical protein HC028_08420 [Planosporangium flavigriseum]|uniref:Uncharacterized protein n=1 Tax=Planosporangium flavigriseum TaxID=373681 RepID=A0A8J3LK16_9ACTN|nr:hypothetical protein [Planosporangium flavigriseum]NJC64528.1 hypothetical protein [Planosporangium flavigriseum]GIG71990.1 hypothetical protein Pfl04_03940 [Planosporangium flavigriseum]